MAYLEPRAFTRHIVNPLVSRLQTGGVATLTVPGRRTGRAQHGAGHPGRGRGHPVPGVPVWRIAVGTQSARGRQGRGKATLARKGKVETFQAGEIAVPGRAAIIAAYWKVCGRAVDPCFTKLPDPSDHPVFRVDGIGTSSRT